MKHILDFSSKAWVPFPGWTYVRWGGGQNSTFSEYGHVAYQFKGTDACSNMVAKILPLDTPSTLGVGLKGQIFFFSERSPVAYQI